jgi:hypothetical protein
MEEDDLQEFNRQMAYRRHGGHETRRITPKHFSLVDGISIGVDRMQRNFEVSAPTIGIRLRVAPTPRPLSGYRTEGRFGSLQHDPVFAQILQAASSREQRESRDPPPSTTQR